MSESTVQIVSLEAIRAASNLKEKLVHVPEWGGHVRIRELSKAVEKDLRKQAMVSGELDTNMFEMLLLVYGIVEPQLTPSEHIGMLQQLSATVVNRVLREIMDLNGMLPDSLKRAEGNFRQES